MKHPSIAIVGAGRLGSALAMRLAEAGYCTPEILVREKSPVPETVRKLARKVQARVETVKVARLTADLIWFCVPDAEVASTAAALSHKSWQGKLAFHSSGVLTSDALASLRKRGAKLASVHPLMTFVAGSLPQLRGVSFAIEGDPAATRAAKAIVRDLGGGPWLLDRKDKAAYHAFATMICPMLVSLLKSAEAVAALARLPKHQVRRRMMPILRQTLDNYIELGPAAAFSGPIVRGDAETVRLHLRSLEPTPTARNVYMALARAALEYLPSRRKRELQKLLQQASAT